MPYSHRQTYQHKLAMNFNWPLEGTLLQNGFYFLFSFSISIRPPLPMFMASCLCFFQSSNSDRVFIPEMSFAKVFGKGYRLIVVVLTLSSLSAYSYKLKKTKDLYLSIQNEIWFVTTAYTNHSQQITNAIVKLKINRRSWFGSVLWFINERVLTRYSMKNNSHLLHKVTSDLMIF